MKRNLHYLPFLFFILFSHPVIGQPAGNQIKWTEEKLGKIIIKADKEARKKQWSHAIIYGEQILKAVQSLNQHSDARYINQIKTLNRYYDKSDRLEEVAPRVKEAYILSQKYMAPDHDTTMMCRLLYYKLLISTKDYKGAIPLVLENISLLGKNDDYRLLHYLKQLYSLYGITAQHEREEKTLLKYLEKSQLIFDDSDEDTIKAIWILAQNYCRQKKSHEFNQLIKTYNLKYEC